MTEPDNQQCLAGTFWQVDTPERRVPGELTLEAGRLGLEVTGQLFVERANKVEFHPSGAIRSIAVGGNADNRVADWQERTIHGVLNDGTPVSVVGAQGGMKRSKSIMDLQYRQEFRTLRHIIVNEHVDDRTTYHSCQFRVTGPIWYTTSHDEAETSDGGRLVVTHEGDSCLFEFIPPQALTIKDLEARVLSPVRTLASIVSFNPTGKTDFGVRREAASPLREVHEEDDAVPRGRHELLDTRHLTASRFAHWIDFRGRSDALDAAAIDNQRGVAIQTQVLTLSAVAEGLHRRLFEGQTRIPAISKVDLALTRRAARRAALDQLRSLDRADREPLTDADLTEFTAAVNQAFAFLNDLTFRARMADLADIAGAAIPGIVSAFDDWPKAVKDARNLLAHQGTRPYNETIDEFYDLLIALGYSIAWVLRTVLLVEAGIDGVSIQRAYDDFSQYEHHLANTRDLLAGSRYAAPASP